MCNIIKQLQVIQIIVLRCSGYKYKYKYKIKTYNAPYVTRVIRRRGVKLTVSILLFSPKVSAFSNIDTFIKKYPLYMGDIFHKQ